jgi:putative GTP pyrophosphokinase
MELLHDQVTALESVDDHDADPFSFDGLPPFPLPKGLLDSFMRSRTEPD